MNIKEKIKFIKIFIIIGLESLGNMSAVTTVLEQNLIKKNNLVSEEDILDAIALARLGPGATTANAVAFLGNTIGGFFGGIVATVCYTIAPLIIIIIIYSFIEIALKYNFVISFLKGSIISICLLFIKSTYSMGKNVLTNKFYLIVFFISLLISLIFNISGAIIILLSIFFRNN